MRALRPICRRFNHPRRRWGNPQILRDLLGIEAPAAQILWTCRICKAEGAYVTWETPING